MMRHAQAQAQDETMRLLYEASLQGSVETLNSLIENDQLVLDRISLTHLSETPLHISALRGHLEFTRALLTHKPKLAAELDSLRRLPLHLAAAEGHTEVVKALLSAGAAGSCKAKDEDGRTPLHLAAMRGRIEVMQELMRVCPESIMEKVDGYTVLHLCVQYNHLEALKLVVEWVSRSNNIGHESILNEMDLYEYTILHQAVMLKQVETVEYLLSKEAIQAKANDERALDLLEQHHPRDFKSFEIRELLARAGMARPRRRLMVQDSSTTPPPADHTKWIRKLIQWLRKGWHKYEFGDWIEKCRGSLMVVATVMTTMSFQVAINPPGGVWQQDSTNHYGCSKTAPCLMGTAVAGYTNRSEYRDLLRFNTVSFVSSIGVVVILISGLPLRNKFSMWLLTLTMIASVTFMWVTYFQSIVMVNPDVSDPDVENFYGETIFAWVNLLRVLGLFLTIRFLCWMVNKCYRLGKRCSSSVKRCVRGEGETQRRDRV